MYVSPAARYMLEPSTPAAWAEIFTSSARSACSRATTAVMILVMLAGYMRSLAFFS